MDVELMDSSSGGRYKDRQQWTDDYGHTLPSSEHAICTSLTNIECPKLRKTAVFSNIGLKNNFPSRDLQFSANKDFNPHALKQFIISDRNIFHRNPFIEHQQTSSINTLATKFQSMIGNFNYIKTEKYTVKKKKKRYPPSEKHLEMDSKDKNVVDEQIQIASKTDVGSEILSESDSSVSETVDIDVEIYGDEKVLDEMGIKREDLDEVIDDLVTKLVAEIEKKEEEVYIQGLYGNDDGNDFMRNINSDRKQSGDNNRESEEQREEETV